MATAAAAAFETATIKVPSDIRHLFIWDFLISRRGYSYICTYMKPLDAVKGKTEVLKWKEKHIVS